MLSRFLIFGLDWLEGDTLMYACIGAGALVLFLIVLITALAVRSKKKKKALKASQTEQKVQLVETPVAPVEEAHIAEEPQPVEDAQPVVEPQPVEEVKAVEEPVVEVKEELKSVTANTDDETDDEKDSEEDDKEEDEQVRKVRKIDGHIRYIIIKYNKSFTAKIIQSSDEVKAYYSEIKNELLSYKGVKARMSWKGETFYSGRVTYAKLCVRGKCLSLFPALDPKNYVDSKYIVDDMTEIATYEKTPCLYRLKNDRRIRYSKELIETVMAEREKLPEPELTDWASQYPYEETQPLVDRGLIKELTEEDAQSGDVFAPRDYVAANEVDELMQDEVAAALVEETDEFSDKTKTDIVNIDTLSKHFKDGETVTLEEMKKRIPAIHRKATYIKVLARGTLDKKLTVIADSFSIEAVKMILLTGGDVVKKKNL